MPFAPHALEFFKLRRVDATLVFGDRQLQGSDRKILANELRAAVTSIFRPVLQQDDL